MLYVLSGALSVALDGSNQLVSDGGGVFIPAGRAAIFSTTSSESARWLQFILPPAAESQNPPLRAPASVEEWYPTPEPLPGPRRAPAVSILPPPPSPPANRP